MLRIITLFESIVIELYKLWKLTKITYSWMLLRHPETHHVTKQVLPFDILNAIRIKVIIEPAAKVMASGTLAPVVHNGITYISTRRKLVPTTRLAINLSVLV